jgi:hypothetical protein
MIALFLLACDNACKNLHLRYFYLTYGRNSDKSPNLAESAGQPSRDFDLSL